ncbi:MAG: peptidase MA family metallohydrolase [Bellilinea sp.]
MRLLATLTLLISSLFSLGFRWLQADVEFVNITHTVVFGERLEFSGAIETRAAVVEVVLFLKPFGADTQVIPLKPAADGTVNLTYDLENKPLRAFTPVDYWYQVKLESGVESSSPVYTFLYEDNRFDWQRQDSATFKLSWATTGDPNFGAALQNSVQDSLKAAQAILPAALPTPVRIYVYPSAQEMQSAARLAAAPWAAGHASPDMGVILISITPGPDARAEMERQLPHEIMHILEYQVAGSAYNQLPTWLLEGLASNAELYPNPDYQSVLQKAVDEHNLLPLSALCQDFPRELSGALLGYAQSGSFVRFLIENFGSSGILNLMNRYADGLNCEAGVQAAFNSSLQQLETRWQQEFLGLNAGLTAWKQVWPYFLLAFLVIVPLGLSILPILRKRQEIRGTNDER